jgi:hypothetical protein
MLMLVDEIRSMVEETPVSTYEELLGDYDQICRRYKRMALRSMKKQFILNIPRYSSSNIYETVRSFAASRLGEQK